MRPLSLLRARAPSDPKLTFSNLPDSQEAVRLHEGRRRAPHRGVRDDRDGRRPQADRRQDAGGDLRQRRGARRAGPSRPRPRRQAVRRPVDLERRLRPHRAREGHDPVRPRRPVRPASPRDQGGRAPVPRRRRPGPHAHGRPRRDRSRHRPPGRHPPAPGQHDEQGDHRRHGHDGRPVRPPLGRPGRRAPDAPPRHCALRTAHQGPHGRGASPSQGVRRDDR